jgi:DNA-binding response OmpR family regulator
MTIACYVRDKKTSRMLVDVLGPARLPCEIFESENNFLRVVRRESYDLILIDTGGEADTEERFLSWLNCRSGTSTPVIILSDVSSPARIVRALEAGADDVVAKPFDTIELVARINAVMRRCRRSHSEKTISLAGFVLDQNRGVLQDRGIPIELTPREFTMAWLLFSSPGAYLSRETISMAIWGVERDIANRTIEQHVYKLRKKLQLSAERGITIRTGYTQGYRLELVRDHKTEVQEESLDDAAEQAASEAPLNSQRNALRNDTDNRSRNRPGNTPASEPRHGRMAVANVLPTVPIADGNAVAYLKPKSKSNGRTAAIHQEIFAAPPFMIPDPWHSFS